MATGLLSVSVLTVTNLAFFSEANNVNISEELVQNFLDLLRLPNILFVHTCCQFVNSSILSLWLQLVDKVMEWSSVLEIRSVSVLDYINYTCIANNRLGTLTSMYALTPPVLPATPLYFNVSLWFCTVVIYEMYLPSYSGIQGGSMLKYNIFYMIMCVDR